MITTLVPFGIFALACYGATAVVLHFMSKDEDERLTRRHDNAELRAALLADAVRDLELSREAIENDIVAMSQEIETLKGRIGAIPGGVNSPTSVMSVHWEAPNDWITKAQSPIAGICNRLPEEDEDEDDDVCWFCGQPGCHEH